MSPHRAEEEYQRREQALDDVLLHHLGPPPDHDRALDAEYVLMATWLPSAGTGAMSTRHEREKLAKVRRLAGEIAAAWEALNPAVRGQMELRSFTIFEAAGRFAFVRSRDPLYLGMLSVLDGVVDIAAPFGEAEIERAPPAGRRDLLNVALVDRLRNVWQERKGAAAPKSMSEAGPFADFMFDAFQALDLTANPRAAVDAWRAFRDSDPSARQR